MNQLALDPAELDASLRAAKAVAMADGSFAQRERTLLQAAVRALGSDVDVDALRPITPAAAAAALPGQPARLRLIQAQIIMAMMDGDISAEELAVIRAFSAALGVDEPRLANLRQYLAGHFTLVKFDLSRRSVMIDDVVKDSYRKSGLRGVWKTLGPFRGLASDPQLSWRYRQLGLLPEGTLGREYWTHMVRRKFSFPGDPGGFPEGLIKHDLCHVLGDYDTDSIGECEVVGFICGFMRRDPFWYLFMIVMHMHLGVETFDATPTDRLAADPERLLAAIKRGSQVNADLYDTAMDWWPLMDRPIEEVRARFNILPK